MPPDMSDVNFDIGVDLGTFKQELRAAERQLTASVRAMNSAVQTQVAAMNRPWSKITETTGDFVEAQSSAEVQAKKTAVTVNSEDVDEAARKWQLLTLASEGMSKALNVAAEEARDTAKNLADVVSPSVIQRAQDLAGLAFKLRVAYGTIVQLGTSFLSAPIVRASSDLEQLQTRLQATFQSASAGRAAFAWIDEFQGKLPGFEEALVTLRNNGLDPFNGSLANLNAIAARAGGGTDKLRRIALQVGQAWAGNALRLEEINSLIDNGVPVWEGLQEVTGKNVQQLREMASEGELTRETISRLLEVLGEASQQSVDLNLDTFQGQLNALSKEFTQILRDIGSAGVFQFFKDQVAGLIARMQELRASGELEKIVQGINNVLLTLGQQVANIINKILDGLIKLASSGQLEKFANLGALALQQISDSVSFLIDNFGGLAKAAGIAFAAFKVVGLALAITAFVELSRNLGLVRRALARIGLVQFLKDVVVQALRAGRALAAFVFSLTVVRAELIATLTTFAAYTALLGGVAVALFIGVDRLNKYMAAQRELQALTRANTQTTRQFIDLLRDSEKLDLSGVRQQISDLNRLRNLGFITDEEALRLANERYNEAFQLIDQIKRAEQELAQLQIQARTEAAEKIKRANEDLLRDTISKKQEELTTAKQKLSEIEREEKKAVERIKEIRRELVETRATTEDRIADIRRRGLSEARQQRALESQAETAIAEAIIKRFEAQRATTEEARKQAIEESNQRLERARSLTGEVTSRRTQIDLVRSIGREQQNVLKEEQALQEAVAERAAKEKAAQKETIEAIKERIKALKQELKTLEDEPPKIGIEDNINEVADRIDELREKLRALDKQKVSVNVDSSGIPEVGFAHGGPVPGKGTGDTVPAWLTPGEFVVTRTGSNLLTALRYYAAQWPQVRSQILAAILPQLKLPRIKLPTLPAASVQRFASGGPVAPVAPGRGEEITLVFKTPSGQTARARSSREDAGRIVDAFTRISRGLPA